MKKIVLGNTYPKIYLTMCFFFTFHLLPNEVVMSQKKWSKAEEYIFSYLCIKQYVIPSLTVEEFLNFAHKSLPRISKSSLKAKLSNVKHLLDTKQISNTIPLKPLKNFSKANEDAINDLVESLMLRWFPLNKKKWRTNNVRENVPVLLLWPMDKTSFYGYWKFRVLRTTSYMSGLP